MTVPLHEEWSVMQTSARSGVLVAVGLAGLLLVATILLIGRAAVPASAPQGKRAPASDTRAPSPSGEVRPATPSIDGDLLQPDQDNNPTPASAPPSPAPRPSTTSEFSFLVVGELMRPVPSADVLVYRDTPRLDQWSTVLPRIAEKYSITLAEARRRVADALRVSENVDPAPSDLLTQGQTDEMGVVTLSLGTVDCLVVASQPHYGSSGLVPLAHLSPDLKQPDRVLVALRPYGCIRGRVTSAAGTPLPATTIVSRRLHQPGETLGMPRAPNVVETNAQGEYELLVDSPISLALHAESRDYGASGSQNVVVLAASTVTIDFQCGAVRQLTGTVTGPSNEPVAGATVEIVHEAGLTHTGKTDVFGNFSVPLSETGRHILVVKADGLVQPEPSLLEFDGNTSLAPCIVHMITESSVAGRLVWDSGEPVVGHAIRAQATKPVLSYFLRLGHGVDVYGIEQFAHFFNAFSITDANGRFDLQQLHPGFEYELTYSDPRNSASDLLHLPGVLAGLREFDLVVGRSGSFR